MKMTDEQKGVSKNWKKQTCTSLEGRKREEGEKRTQSASFQLLKNTKTNKQLPPR